MGVEHKLVKAVKHGDLHLVKNLLDAGADIETRVSDSLKKRTLLHHAAQKGHTDILIYLLKKGIFVDVEDADGKTPLWYAAEENQYEIAKILVENNAAINLPGDWNPLERASECSYNGTEVMELLISSGADVNLVIGGTKHIALASALRQEKIEASLILIENNSKINHVDANGETPIMGIAYFDREEHLKLLIKKGATLKGKNLYSGNEILHNAAFGGFPRSIKILIDNGADINAINKKGQNPLHIAVERKKVKAVKMLLTAGAKQNIKDNNGNTPYDIAINLKNGNSIVKLLEKK